LITVNLLSAQKNFRSGIFLHHSTGNYIWGPNPDGHSTTSVPQQMQFYNSTHGFTGSNAIKMNEEWWSPGDNEWSTQHKFFEGNTSLTDVKNYMANNKIIVVKSCFPSSSIEALGAASDTLYPNTKSVYNYKWHWRHIVKVMEKHPEVFFAIWTNAPLEASSTNATEAGLSRAFCKWAKDTLAVGLDRKYGRFPANVYVFDFFNKLTDSKGIMQNQYRTSAGDSHPNGLATDLVAPQFVKEIFDAALAYEKAITNIENTGLAFSNVKIYPNPANGIVNIELNQPSKTIHLILSTATGQTVVRKTIENQSANRIVESIDVSGFSKGIYFVQIQDDYNAETQKIIVQ
jgi:hypothetical protein